MGVLKLNTRQSIGAARVRGRDYFQRAERELKIEALDPVAIRKKLKRLPLKDGSSKSRVGGSIAHNLKQLSPRETKERAERSERFLKQPDSRFPAEEDQPQSPDPRK